MCTAIRICLLLLAPALLAAADDSLVFLHPLTGPAAHDPALADAWVAEYASLMIEPEGRDAYRLEIGGMMHESSVFRFRLVEIAGEKVADIMMEGPDPDLQPIRGHRLARLRVDGDTLNIDVIGSELLRKRITQTRSPRHERVQDPGKDVLVVVTAAGAELRRFVEDCLKHPEMLESETFTRADPEEKASALDERSRKIVLKAGREPDAYRSALQSAEEAVRLAPADADYRNTLGAALYRLGRYSEALTAIAHAENLRQEPDSDDLAFRAMIHFKLGEKEQAEPLLTKIRKMVGDEPPCRAQEEMPLLKQALELTAPKKN